MSYEYLEKNIIQCCFILKGYAHLFDDKTAVLSNLEHCRNNTNVWSNNTYDININIYSEHKYLCIDKTDVIGMERIHFNIGHKTKDFNLRTDSPERLVALLNKYLKVNVNDHIAYLHNKIIDLEEQIFSDIEEFKTEVINMIQYAPGGFEAKMAQKEFEQLSSS